MTVRTTVETGRLFYGTPTSEKTPAVELSSNGTAAVSIIMLPASLFQPHEGARDHARKPGESSGVTHGTARRSPNRVRPCRRQRRVGRRSRARRRETRVRILKQKIYTGEYLYASRPERKVREEVIPHTAR